MKICPQCQTEYDDTRKFCRHDGSPLEAKKTEERIVQAGVLTCPQCGKAIEAGKKFCRYCGTPIAPKTLSKIEQLERQLAEAPTQVSVAVPPRIPTKIELLERQLAEAPTWTSVMVDLAEEYLKDGRARRAVELLEKAVSYKSEDAHVHFLLGQAREAAGDHDRALDAYLAALELDAWNPEAETALFREDLLLRTYPRSVDELSRVAVRKGSVQIWRLLAQVSEVKGDHDKAAAFLAEAVRVKPDDIALLESLAQIYEQGQRTEEAAEWHKRILKVNLSARASNLFFAQSHYTQDEYEQAIPYFERLLVGEQANRVYRLYWLLANVKGYGIQGCENGIAELLQWQNLTEKEKPLARELFVLAGKDSLEKGELAAAEQHLLRAYHLSPSRDVAGMLAAVEERKGELAQQQEDFRQALVSYQKAAEYDPGNQTYARKIARVVSLRTEENWRKRQAIQRKIAQGVGLGLATMLLIASGVFGYRKAREWYQTPPPQDELTVAASPEGTAGNPETVGDPAEDVRVSSFVAGSPEGGQHPGNGDDKSQVSGQEPGPIATATEPPKEEPGRGKVVTARELGIRVSGKGAGDSNRSSEAIQQEVETYLASLREVYEIERASDPSLMGSLVLDLKIAPDGRTSNARLQSAKIASKKLQDIVHGLVHEWRFSPASGEVQVSYPLLFLPPGMDAASIIAWERSTAALKTSQRPLGVTPDGTPERPPAPSSAPKKQMSPGMYQVRTATPLRGEPRTDAFVVTQLRPGIKVRVVGMVGDYLEVRSRQGRHPGYVHQKDVVFVSSR